MLRKMKKNMFLIWTLLPAVMFLVAFFVIIVFYLLKISLTQYSGGVAQDTATVSNFVKLATSTEFLISFRRTLLFVLVVTPLQLVTGLITAMLINNSFKGRGVVRSVFLLPLSIPSMVTTAILLLMFSQGGHITSLLMGQYPFFPKVTSDEVSFISNEVLALGLATFGKVWRDTPISMLILLAGLQSINSDQYEAARTMGSSPTKNFLYITVPSLIPAISSVLVLRSIEAWKEFIFPYVLAPSFPVLGVLIEKYYIQLQNPGMASAIGVILILVILIGTFILNFILKKLNQLLVKV